MLLRRENIFERALFDRRKEINEAAFRSQGKSYGHDGIEADRLASLKSANRGYRDTRCRRKVGLP